MSEIRATTISDSAGTGPITLTKQSAAKAWTSWNQATPGIHDSLNTSSLTDTATGKGALNWTSSFDGALTYTSPSNANYVSASDAYTVSLCDDYGYNTRSGSVWSYKCTYSSSSTAAFFDPQVGQVNCQGDLA